jgi:hypothetical protein
VVDNPLGSGSDIVRVNCSRLILVSAVGRGPGLHLSLHVPPQPTKAGRAQGDVLPGKHPVLGCPGPVAGAGWGYARVALAWWARRDTRDIGQVAV